MDEQVKQAIVDVVKEGNAEVLAKQAELETKLKAIENLSISQKNVGIIVPEVYKGYKLNKQFEQFRHLTDEQTANNISKFVVDLAVRGANKESYQVKAAGNQNEGTDASGGYLTIDEFDSIITKTAREMSVMLPLVDNRTIGRTDTFKFNKQLANASLAWDSEGTVTNTSATYSQGSISIKRLSGYVGVSNELLADSAYDITSDLTEQFAYAMAQEMDNQILNGTGTPCSGVLTAAAGYSVILGAGLTNWSSVAAGDFSLAIAALTTVDASNGTFVLGKKGAHWVRTLKDTTNAPIYQAISGPNLDTIYGQPRVIANKINDATGGTGGFYAVFGDFKQFLVVNRIGQLELLVDPYSDAVSYNTRFYYATRKGLGIRRATAFCRMGTA